MTSIDFSCQRQGQRLFLLHLFVSENSLVSSLTLLTFLGPFGRICIFFLQLYICVIVTLFVAVSTVETLYRTRMSRRYFSYFGDLTFLFAEELLFFFLDLSL